MIFLDYDKWLVYDVDSWKIKNDCPQKIKKQIQKMLDEKKQREEKGTILD